MTNSESFQKAKKNIEKIFELIGPEYLQREFDDRINEAAATFSYDMSAPFSHKLFHKVISDFVRHVYEHGLSLSQKLTPLQAHAEAIFILEQDYSNIHEKGYDAALIDASNPEIDGISLILICMKEIIKSRERKKHTRWVFAIYLEMMDWQTRCHMAKILIEYCFLSQEVLQYTPAQLADELPYFLKKVFSIDS